MKDLPQGEDQTINNIPPEKVRSLFDSTNTSKLATSKVVEGLRAWAKFGAEISGANSSSIFSISKSQIAKNKVSKKFQDNKTKRKEQKKSRRNAKVGPSEPPEEPKLNLDRKNYGAWYINPKKWEKRFQKLSDPKSIEHVKARRVPKGDKQSAKQDSSSQTVSF